MNNLAAATTVSALKGQRDFPKSADLLPDIFSILCKHTATHMEIASALAAIHGVTEPEIDVCDPPLSNNSFRSRADAAIGYLTRGRLIDRKRKKGPLFITQAGFEFLHNLTPELLRELAPVLEPKIKLKAQKPRGKVTVTLEPRQQPSVPRSVTVNLPAPLPLQARIEKAKKKAPPKLTPEQKGAAIAAKIASNLPGMPLDKLYSLWANVRQKRGQGPEETRIAAEMLLVAITEERERRGPEASSPLPNGHIFRWPTTEAETTGKGGLSIEADAFGVLALAGYRVGVTRGEPTFRRLNILARLFEEDIPDVSQDGEWGTPGTSKRLKKLAYTIAALTRNAKRRGPQMAQAVADWESDLDHLHERYYVGRFGFSWPATGPKTEEKDVRSSAGMGF